MDRFKLRFDEAMIPELAGRYSYPYEEKMILDIGPRTKIQGYFNKDDFEFLCHWKTPRSQSKVRKNSPKLIEDATHCFIYRSRRIENWRTQSASWRILAYGFCSVTLRAPRPLPNN